MVGECDDSFLNDSVGRHILSEHTTRLERAQGAVVAEGSVGAGTGMVCCDFKAGIGTSSRRVAADNDNSQSDHHTIGVLVLSNFGVCRNLRVDGVPIGQLIEPEYQHIHKRTYSYGSIICVVATDAPLLSNQLNRLCKRAALGIGRVASTRRTARRDRVGFSPPTSAARGPIRPSLTALLDHTWGSTTSRDRVLEKRSSLACMAATFAMMTWSRRSCTRPPAE